MKKKILNTYLILGVSGIVLLACTKDVDFNQVDDFEVSPVVESSLIFLNEPANQFYENNAEVTTVQDSVLIDVFEDQFVQDYLVKAAFFFETQNSINRSFQLRVDFLADADVLVHSFDYTVPSSPNNAVLNSNYTEVFEGDDLVSLKATRKLIFTLSLLDGTPINENTPGTINMKSKGTFYLNIDDTL
ncbi:hypothetical protein [Seonamhaeicola sp.]|uniref:hypothetical protein n=1 Tax=Seonamhaeicola sp. TaxID=1912245 RepID=UPI00261049FC|nr:hypothetical protein [Seonamhaeicola sp.]